MVNWNELTPGQQAYLDTLARAGDVWTRMVYGQEHYFDSVALCDLNLVEADENETRDRITAAGLTVWQQGQTPRTVWVAMWWQYGEYALGASYLVGVYSSSDTAMIACQNIHKNSTLKWSNDTNWRGYDRVRDGYFELVEQPILP